MKEAPTNGSEDTILNKDIQMRFLRSLLGLASLDMQRNTISREKNYKYSIWLKHHPVPPEVERKFGKHGRYLPLLAFEYHSSERRHVERPKQRWKDQQDLQDQEEEAVTDLKLNSP